MGTLTGRQGLVDQRLTSNFGFAVRLVVIDDHHDGHRLMGHVVEQAGTDVTVVGYANNLELARWRRLTHSDRTQCSLRFN
jgi:hypothetical protein